MTAQHKLFVYYLRFALDNPAHVYYRPRDIKKELPYIFDF